MHTIYGLATSRKVLAKFVDQYIIGGETYTRLLPEINKLVPSCYRTTDGWYQSNMRQLLILLFPHWYTKCEYDLAKAFYIRYYPDVYEHITSVSILPTKLISEINIEIDGSENMRINT